MSRNGSAPVGLPAQQAINGALEALGSSRVFPSRAETCPETLPARLLPVKAAAVYIGVSPRSLWRLVDAGHLHPVRLPGLRRVAFERRELDALVEASRDR